MPKQRDGWEFALVERERDVALARLAAAETVLRRFVEAWWEYDGPAFEPLDAAASEGLSVLGDVIALVADPAAEETT